MPKSPNTLKAAKHARKSAFLKRSCLNKVAYKNEQEAFQKNQQTYKCSHCGNYHRSGSLTAFVNTFKSRFR